MMKLITILLISLVPLCLSAQETEGPVSPEMFGVGHLTEYLGLKPDDISFRSDYTEPDSFRLVVVADLMHQPLGMIDYVASLKGAYVSTQPEILASVLFQDLKVQRQNTRSRPYQPDVAQLQRRYNLYFIEPGFNQFLSRAAQYVDIILPRSVDKSLALLSPEQRKFLRQEFVELVTVPDNQESLSVEAVDSIEKIEEGYTEKFVGFGTLYDKDPTISAGIDCLRELNTELGHLIRQLKVGQIKASKIMNGAVYLPEGTDRNSYLGVQNGWKIGGTGNDYYSGQYKFIFDFGGDDVYDLSYDIDNPQSTIIIDLSGNDSYRGQTDGLFGSGFLSVGILLDLEGDDTYRAGSFSLGSGYFGFGILYDAAGNDLYQGDNHTEGAGTFGLGLLIDEDGHDIYDASLNAQGCGSVEGAGMLYDRKGSDCYRIGGKYNDILRYEEHDLSFSQGFAAGMSPYMSGGIGALFDIEGNDAYLSDIFAQGSSYWWSLGILYDSAGNDNYQSYQYAQGCGTHMTLGTLIDDYGNDVYFGKGLMQGCGHDYACGLILDRHGDDVYTASDLSQAGGSANGVGILIDNDGDDRYFIRNANMTHGYGNPRRDYGSIGLFIDLGGDDLTNGLGQNNYYWRTGSKWGGGVDIELTPPEKTEDGDDD